MTLSFYTTQELSRIIGTRITWKILLKRYDAVFIERSIGSIKVYETVLTVDEIKTFYDNHTKNV